MATARRRIPMLLLTAIALAACGGGTPDGAVPPTLLAADECRAAELAMATAAGGGSTATGTTPSPDQAIATLRRIAADAAAGIRRTSSSSPARCRSTSRLWPMPAST